MATQLTIQLDTGTDIGNETLVNDLKRYAREQFNWQEQIPDPDFVATDDNPTAPMIDNPTTYLQAVFIDYMLKEFWNWKTMIAKQEAVIPEIDAMKESTVLSVMPTE